jgi:MFS family permease
VASAAAIAVAVGPLVGGLFTTYASWRWVFAGEVVIVLALLGLTSRLADTPPERGVRLDPVGTVLSAAGLGLVVYGIIRTGTWGFVVPKPDAPEWLGASLCVWLMLGGAIVLAGFIGWEGWRVQRGRAVLVDPAMLRVPKLQAGLLSFFFQFLLQAGLFFVIPLFLSIALGLSAVATGVRLLPLSLALLFSAALVPRLFRNGSPRRIVRVGFGLVFLGLLVLVLALDQGSGPEVITVPLILVGIGIGALASQLGAVTVSAVPDEKSSEVGGLQYTVTNLGASIGTALAGAVLISVLTTTFLAGVSNNPAVPQEMSSKAPVELSAGIPFVSDAQLQSALQGAGVPTSTAQAITDQNAASRINGLRASIALLALIALIALALTRRLPVTPVGVEEAPREEADEGRERARPPPA